ncbi:hypothetical protein ACSQ67_010921 [Phaseolus vulgaris]
MLFPLGFGWWDEGGPLGLLQPVNARTELVRNSDNAGTGTGSISFNTLLTASPPSSTDSSSDLDTQVSEALW